MYIYIYIFVICMYIYRNVICVRDCRKRGGVHCCRWQMLSHWWLLDFSENFNQLPYSLTMWMQSHARLGRGLAQTPSKRIFQAFPEPHFSPVYIRVLYMLVSVCFRSITTTSSDHSLSDFHALTRKNIHQKDRLALPSPNIKLYI